MRWIIMLKTASAFLSLNGLGSEQNFGTGWPFQRILFSHGRASLAIAILKGYISSFIDRLSRTAEHVVNLILFKFYCLAHSMSSPTPISIVYRSLENTSDMSQRSEW